MSKVANFILTNELYLIIPLMALLIINNPFSWLGLLAVAPWLLRWRYRGYLTIRTPFDLPFALFFFGLFVSLYPSVDLRLSMEALRGYIGSIIIYYAIVNNATPRLIKQLIIVASCLLVLGTLFSLTTPTKVNVFNSWLFDLAKALPKVEYLGYSPHLNNLAGVLGTFVAFLAGMVLFAKNRSERILAGALGAPFGIVLLLTTSRASWIGLGIALALLTLRRNRWFLLAMAACIGFVVITLSSGMISSKDLLEIGSGNTLIPRTQLWASTLDMLGDMPLTGVGLGNFPLVYRLYVSPAQPYVLTHPHNTLLQIYTDTGLIGMLAFLLGAFVIVKVCFHLLRTAPTSNWYGYVIGTVAGFVALFIHGFFESSGVAIAADVVGNYHYTVIPTVFVLAGVLTSSLNLLKGEGVRNSVQMEATPAIVPQKPILRTEKALFLVSQPVRISWRLPVVIAVIAAILVIGNGREILGVVFRNLGDVELVRALLQEDRQNQEPEIRFALASKLLSSASEWNPGDLRVLRSMGRIAFEQKDYDGAADLLVKYLAVHPSDAIARTQLGFAYAASGQEDKANQEWLLGGTAGYFYEEATKSLENKDFQRAYELADRAIRLSPQLPGPLYVHGRALAALGRIGEAANSLRASVGLYDYLGEAGPESMMARGYFYLIAGGWKRSLSAFEAVTQHKNSTDEQKFEAFEGMGKVLSKRLGRPTEAIEAYSKAAELEPKNFWEPLNIGDILCEQGQVVEAREWYGKAARLSPNNDEIVHRVALSYVVEGRLKKNAGKRDEAMTSFATALEIEPELAEAHFAIGEVLLAEGQDPLAAEDHFLQVVELAPDQPDLLLRSYMYLSDSAQMTGRPSESKEWLAKAEALRSH